MPLVTLSFCFILLCRHLTKRSLIIVHYYRRKAGRRPVLCPGMNAKDTVWSSVYNETNVAVNNRRVCILSVVISRDLIITVSGLSRVHLWPDDHHRPVNWPTDRQNAVCQPQYSTVRQFNAAVKQTRACYRRQIVQYREYNKTTTWNNDIFV